GLIVKRGNPKNIWSIKDLSNPDVLFVNRQPGSGTRIILDLLLAQENATGRDINGFEQVELTHAAVGAFVASGKADAGLGVETAARQFDLDFIPVISERYFLLCDQRTLSDARFKPIHYYLKSSEFRTEISKLPGYDSSSTGVVMSLQEAFLNGAIPA
ncbi:MAG TPA: substrate-binding domain-containing protein, partial [Sedimentisphaerales bacterium]